jgi:hypothetical protein
VHLGAEDDLSHPSHHEPSGLDHEVHADETIADGSRGPTA